MRDIKSVFYDTSILDKMTGITFRGYTIPDLVNHLPKAIPDGEPLPEGLFYLLMTGELPTDEDSNDIKEFWSKNGKLSDETLQFIKQLPVDTHPMTMLSMSLLFLQRDSVFHKLYAEGKLN
jgi:citrate synthase